MLDLLVVSMLGAMLGSFMSMLGVTAIVLAYDTLRD